MYVIRCMTGSERGSVMAANLRRFTISVTKTMDDALEKAKKEQYDKVSQNEMIRDLIIRGLKTLEQEETDPSALPPV